MDFSSVTFLFLFLPVVMSFYFISSKKWRKGILLGSSLVFFGWGSPVCLLYLLAVITVNYFCAKSMEVSKKNDTFPRTITKMPLIVGVCFNLLVLILAQNNALSTWLPTGFDGGVATSAVTISYLAPLGVAIFCLQGISYLVSVARHEQATYSHFVDVALYLGFFPQMVCGPIASYVEMRQEFAHGQTTPHTIARGYSLLIQGLFQKIFVADTLHLLWQSVSKIPHEQLPLLTAWIGMIAVGMSVCFTLMGYSLMARGMAKIFGVTLPMNFNYPFMAKNMLDFLRRFHLSLSTWIKGYVLLPLGKTNGFVHTKLLLLFILMGLWFGFSWNFVFWGAYIGVIIIVENFGLAIAMERVSIALQRVYFYTLITISWVFFAHSNLNDSASYLVAMVKGREVGNRFFDATTLYLLRSYWLYLLLGALLSSSIFYNRMLQLEQNKPTIAGFVRITGEILLTLLCLLAVVSS